MIKFWNNYIDFLKETFKERKSLNSSYSLRAFARDIDINASNLSSIFSGKKGISEKKALDISKRLGLSAEDSKYFCNLVNLKHSRSKQKRELAKQKAESYVRKHSFTPIDESVFKVISDWYHYAILELIDLKDFKSSYIWITKKLKITKEQSKEAIQRLEDLNLIKRKNKIISSTNTQLEISSEVASISIRKLNSQLIKKAEKSIHDQDISMRHLSTLTTAINSKNFNKYQGLIENFKKELNTIIMQDNQKDKPNKVYCLAMQFFNLTQ